VIVDFGLGRTSYLCADITLPPHGAQSLHQHAWFSVDAHPHAIHKDLCRLSQQATSLSGV
jgi:hypothetical protein